MTSNRIGEIITNEKKKRQNNKKNKNKKDEQISPNKPQLKFEEEN